jgi:hypothetical protein
VLESNWAKRRSQRQRRHRGERALSGPARHGGSETQDKQTPWLARQDLIGDFALF